MTSFSFAVVASLSACSDGTSISVRSGKAAQECKKLAQIGPVGVNIHVPASMARFPVYGWDDKFFDGRLMHGCEEAKFFHAVERNHLAVA